MPGTFTDVTAVAQAIGNNPSRVAELMMQHLTQQQCTAFEALIVPVATDEQMLDTLKQIERSFTRMKRDDLATPLSWVRGKIAELAE